MIRLAVEAGEVRAHRVDEQRELLPAGVVLNEAEILRQRAEAALPQPLGDACADKLFLPVMQVDPAVAVDHVADALEVGFGDVVFGLNHLQSEG